MLNQAIQKIQTEMDQNTNNAYIQEVGKFLLQHLESNPGSAEKILTQDKTIGKSLSEMRKVAEKKKVGNYAMLTPQEGFEMVMKYFGITAQSTPDEITKPEPENVDKSARERVADFFDVSLDELLEV
jgi:hypothetical protein